MQTANLSERKSILIVDDERDIREGCKRILGKMGCSVHTAPNGEEGLNLLREKPVDIVLLDLMMPGIGGMEVLRQAQVFDPDLLVLILTGFATIETAVEAMKNGAYDFLPKPIVPDHLRIAVKRALEKRYLMRQAEELKRERQKTLVDLDTEKSRIRGIVESLPNGILVTDTSRRAVLVNPAFLELVNLPRHLKPGGSLENYLPDSGFIRFAKNLCEETNGETPEDNETYEFRTQSKRHLMAHGRPVLDESGTCRGAVVALVDITAVKILDRLKSEFVAKVSHELRSPLATIHEQLNIVLKHSATDEGSKDRKILARAKEKVGGLISLIGDLLDLSRIEVGASGTEQKPIHIESFLSKIVDFLSTRAESNRQNLSLRLRSPVRKPVKANPLELESIFGNLITNALNYSPPGSKIDVIVSQEESFATISVKDSGYGISDRHLEKIFEKFYRVKTDDTRMVTGTGLGLPIVKGLIDELGGHISLESVEGEGSTFTVKIPLSSED